MTQPLSEVHAPAKPAKKVRDPRMGLRTSATLATVLTILGHSVFGFEQSVAHVFVALGTGYACALLFEVVDARANGRKPAFAVGGRFRMVDFLLSTHMTSITLSFLLYTGTRFWVLAFAVAVAIGSKYILRVVVDGKPRHFMNPSNIALTVTFALFAWTSPIPWALTTTLHGFSSWLLPAIIVGLGIRLNLLFTRRLPLIASFLVAFLVQAVVRSTITGNPLSADLAALTNVPLVLFTFYMITDPQTSPSARRGQVAFGAGVALFYGLLLELHFTFNLFYCVTVVTAIRGAWLFVVSRRQRQENLAAPASSELAPRKIEVAA
jgi:enediyne biosynthesis protein E5